MTYVCIFLNELNHNSRYGIIPWEKERGREKRIKRKEGGREHGEWERKDRGQERELKRKRDSGERDRGR